MPEHTPAPTPHRAVYGFGLYLLFKTFFFAYVFWAFVPTSILEDVLGLTYLPDKYFALHIPILALVAITFFAFLIYPNLSLAMTPAVDDVCTLRDRHTIRRCQFVSTINGRRCDTKVNWDADVGWSVQEFCPRHVNDEVSESSELFISDYCDCVDEEKCLLRTEPEHLKRLHEKETVPCVCDLDVADVCKELFGKKKFQ